MPEIDTPQPQDAPGNAATPEALAKWLQEWNAALKTGTVPPDLQQRGVPPGYKVVGDHLEQDAGIWHSIWPGLLGVAGMATLGALVGPALAGGAGGMGAAGAGIGATGAGTAGAGVGAGITSTLGAASAAGAGAGAGAVALLPSTSTVPNTGALVPSTTSSLAAPSASMGVSDWLKTAEDVGNALGANETGRALGRQAAGTANQQQANAEVNLYKAQLAAPSTIAHNAVKGDILANAHDVALSAPSDIPVPKITGGLHPDMFSPATRATGTTITNNAQQSANNLTPVTPPVLPPLPQAGAVDDILNTASTVGNLAKVGAPLIKQIPWGQIFG